MMHPYGSKKILIRFYVLLIRQLLHCEYFRAGRAMAEILDVSKSVGVKLYKNITIPYPIFKWAKENLQHIPKVVNSS